SRCNLRLKNVVSAGRTTAKVPFRHLERLETRRGEERLWPGVEPLAVLHGASRMIGNTPVARGDVTRGLGRGECRDYLGDFAGERGDPCRLRGLCRIFAQHEAVILDCRAAARGVDYDGVQPP